MLQLQCPFCGLRDESEFSFGGEAHIARPLEPDALSDEEWADYLFNRSNVKGFHRKHLEGSSLSIQDIFLDPRNSYQLVLNQKL